MKAVNISRSEIKHSFDVNNSPMTTEASTISHHNLPTLYSAAISNIMELFIDQISNTMLSIHQKS